MQKYFDAAVSFQSNLTLEEVAELISEDIFGGAKFGGKGLDIHEEIPCLFIEDLILGFRVELDGYSGFGKDEWFTLSISNDLLPGITGEKSELIKLDEYLHRLLEFTFRNTNEIRLL